MSLDLEAIAHLSEVLHSRTVVRPSGCLEWTGEVYKRGGHGTVRRRLNGQHLRVRAHRLAWIEANGPIPEGLGVLHRCDNARCVNLAHLFLGTQADNMRDMASKGRGNNAHRAKTHCPQGHPYDDGNTYNEPGGGRACKECGRQRVRLRRLAGKP